MSFHGEDIGAQAPTAEELVPSPWETIELEEADREPQIPAPAATIAVEPTTEAPLRAAAEPPAAATISAAAPDEFSRDSQGDASASSEGMQIAESVAASDTATKDSSFQISNFKSEIEPEQSPSRGGGWTIPLICFGIGLIACCTIIPQADANRRLAYQKELLRRDLESIQNQVSVNDEFLKRVYDDGSLTQRLAQRQMNVVPAGNRVWQDGRAHDAQSMSPYGVTLVPKPQPLPPYQPTGGQFAALCRDPRTNLYLTGAALMMLATGLVMGFAPRAS